MQQCDSLHDTEEEDYQTDSHTHTHTRTHTLERHSLLVWNQRTERDLLSALLSWSSVCWCSVSSVNPDHRSLLLSCLSTPGINRIKTLRANINLIQTDHIPEEVQDVYIKIHRQDFFRPYFSMCSSQISLWPSVFSTLCWVFLTSCSGLRKNAEEKKTEENRGAVTLSSCFLLTLCLLGGTSTLTVTLWSHVSHEHKRKTDKRRL